MRECSRDSPACRAGEERTRRRKPQPAAGPGRLRKSRSSLRRGSLPGLAKARWAPPPQQEGPAVGVRLG